MSISTMYLHVTDLASNSRVNSSEVMLKILQFDSCCLLDCLLCMRICNFRSIKLNVDRFAMHVCAIASSLPFSITLGLLLTNNFVLKNA